MFSSRHPIFSKQFMLRLVKHVFSPVKSYPRNLFYRSRLAQGMFNLFHLRITYYIDNVLVLANLTLMCTPGLIDESNSAAILVSHLIVGYFLIWFTGRFLIGGWTKAWSRPELLFDFFTALVVFVSPAR